MAMNTNLLNALKEIVSRHGGVETLSDARRVKALLADLAASEPRPQKNALIACLEGGFAAMLQNVPAHERGAAKTKLAERLNREEGLDPALCTDTLDMLEAALFGNVSARVDPKVTAASKTPAPQKPEEALYKISLNFQQSGPYNMAQLLRMAEDGQITKDHWICSIGASEWVPVTTIEALKGPVEAREKVEAARAAAAEKAEAARTEAESQHQSAPPPQDEFPVNNPKKKAKKKLILRRIVCVGLIVLIEFWFMKNVMDNILIATIVVTGAFAFLNGICNNKIFGEHE